MSLLLGAVRREAFTEASCFRGEFYECLIARRDALFELVDAVLCADGAVRSPVDLTLVPGHRRGHGAMYGGGLNYGRLDVGRLLTVLAGLSLPRLEGGRLVLVVDVSLWLRSDAPCSAERLFCHVRGRAKTALQFVPGRPYSFVAALEPGATSWTAILDAVRLGPVDDATRGHRSPAPRSGRAAHRRWSVAGRGPTHRGRERCRPRRHPPGPNPARPAGGAGGPGSLRPCDAPAEAPTIARSQRPAAQARGPEFRFTEPETWPEPAITTVTDTTNYGKAVTQARDRVHPRLTHRSSWLDHDGELPLVQGTLMRLKVDHLSKDRDAPSVWLWSSKTGATPNDLDLCWQAFLRRFDLEQHTFRFAKQTPGWTTPKLRTPEAAAAGPGS